mgnify:CR=1 FL=1
MRSRASIFGRRAKAITASLYAGLPGLSRCLYLESFEESRWEGKTASRHCSLKNILQ